MASIATWRSKGNKDYFDGCIRDVLQAERAYRYTLMQSVRDKYPTGSHPLLLAKNKADRYMDIVLECARARLAAQGKLTATN